MHPVMTDFEYFCDLHKRLHKALRSYYLEEDKLVEMSYHLDYAANTIIRAIKFTQSILKKQKESKQ